MATKLNKEDAVSREIAVNIRDKKNEDRPIVVDLRGDGKVDVRLKGMRKVVTVDLMAVIRNDGTPNVSADGMSAHKRTMMEHIRGF